MAKELVVKTDFHWDLERIQRDFETIVEKAEEHFGGAFLDQGQFCLTHTKDWYETKYSKIHAGTGDMRLKHCPGYGRSEEEFTEFVDEFKDTIFYEIWKDFPFRIGRMRITKVPPKALFWMHPDPFPSAPAPGHRFHTAIHTNEHCYLTFPYCNEEPEEFQKLRNENPEIPEFTAQLDWPRGYLFHVPADGFLYKMDARPWHTSFNAGKINRFHLLIDEY